MYYGNECQSSVFRTSDFKKNIFLNSIINKECCLLESYAVWLF
jgi:hypothetical protein